ncbi:hypothetical protein ELQ39_15890 [Streptomyces sp. GB4-14]|uniref:hypothetical protein n=1 Tax=Streptomyces sp. GB4-14 TaxID=2498703 RepID=UPI001F5ED194|nr:hypothetical protein [Streptomyces sp. GB4-14]
MRTTIITLAAGALLLAALTGCSSTDDDAAPGNTASPSAPQEPSQESSTTPPAETSGTPEEPTTGTAALEQAVKDYTSAYFGGEASTAHRMLSERCRGEINELVFGATVKQAAEEYGPDHPATDVQADVSGDLARVSYKVEGLPKFDQSQQPWTLEGGAWKYDAC